MIPAWIMDIAVLLSTGIAVAEAILLYDIWQDSKRMLKSSLAIEKYELEVYRIQSEREKERREWREAKRRQATKKAEVGSNPDILPSDSSVASVARPGME
ncbi:MAG: hypothetical protein OK457_00490 [Thaumarchaeota archaeon]|nr:hypothetical protein [Nitrososphaerota archaeon]